MHRGAVKVDPRRTSQDLNVKGPCRCQSLYCDWLEVRSSLHFVQALSLSTLLTKLCEADQ